MQSTRRACVVAALCVALTAACMVAQAQAADQPQIQPTPQTPTVTPTTPQPQPVQPQPAPAATGPITTPRLGASVTQDGVLSGEGTAFIAANTPTVWAVFDFAGMQPGSTLIVWWLDPGTRSSIPWRVTVPAASGTVAASLTAPATGWTPGSYEVTVTPASGVPALAKVPFTLQ